jgi:hypothetical protein
MKLFVVFSTEEESVAWKYLVDELQQLYSNGHVEPVPFYFGYKGKKYYYNCLYFSKSKLSKFLELYYNGKIKYIKEIVIEKIFVEQKNDELYNNQIAYLQKLLKKIKSRKTPLKTLTTRESSIFPFQKGYFCSDALEELCDKKYFDIYQNPKGRIINLIKYKLPSKQFLKKFQFILKYTTD